MARAEHGRRQAKAKAEASKKQADEEAEAKVPCCLWAEIADGVLGERRETWEGLAKCLTCCHDMRCMFARMDARQGMRALLVRRINGDGLLAGAGAARERRGEAARGRRVVRGGEQGVRLAAAWTAAGGRGGVVDVVARGAQAQPRLGMRLARRARRGRCQGAARRRRAATAARQRLAGSRRRRCQAGEGEVAAGSAVLMRGLLQLAFL